MTQRRVTGILASTALALGLVALASPGVAAPQGESGHAEDAFSQPFLDTESRHRENAALFDDATSPGLYYREGEAEPVIRIFKDALSPKDAARRLADLGSKAVTEASRYTAVEIQALESGVRRVQIAPGKAIGGSYDASRDLFALSGSVDEKLVAEAMPGLAYEYVETAEGTVGRASRMNDPAPHMGGAAIDSSAGAECTSGFAVKVSGATRIVTAGHCGLLGHAFYSPSGGSYHGSMSHRAAFPTRDLALLSGSTYRGRIYVGDTLNVRVAAAANPGVGSTYCFSGRTSGVKCDAKVTSMSGILCDPSGCTSQLIEQTGSRPKPGDSGAPFYARGSSGGVSNAHIRGVVIGFTSTHGYHEPWGQVANQFGATIIVG